MHEPAIRAHIALGVEIVDRRFLQVCHHGIGICRFHGLHRLEIVHGGRVIRRLQVCRHPLGFLKELLAERTRLLVDVPVPAGREHQSFGILQSQCVDVGDEDQQSGQLHILGNAEFACRLDRVLHVATGVRQSQDLRLGVSGLQQVGREVRRIEGMPHRAQHRAAHGLHHRGGVGLQTVSERIVRCQEEPCLAACLHDRAAGAARLRHGVVGIVNRVGSAQLVGQRRTACTDIDVDLLFFLGHLGHGKRSTRVGAADQHGQVLSVEPFACASASDVGLVLMVHRQQFDRHAVDLSPEVIDGHLDGQRAILAVDVGVDTGHVGDESYFQFVLRQYGL